MYFTVGTRVRILDGDSVGAGSNQKEGGGSNSLGELGFHPDLYLLLRTERGR